MTSSLIPPKHVETGLESWTSGLGAVIARSTPDGSLSKARIGNESLSSAIAKRMHIPHATVKNTMASIDKFLVDDGWVDTAKIQNFADNGLESLAPTSHNPVPTYITSHRSINKIKQSAVADMVERCLPGLEGYKLEATCREIANILSSADLRSQVLSARGGNSLTGSATAALDGTITLYDACGARAFGRYANPSAAYESLNAGLESFGANVNALTVNNRLAIAVSILRNVNSTIDKLFTRVSDDTNTVTFVIPNPVLFSLERMNNQSADVRNNPLTEVSLVNIQSDPGIANTTPVSVLDNINPVHDSGPVKFLDMTSIPGKIALNAIGTSMSLLDLTRNDNRFGLDNQNHTDQIAGGGRVRTIVLTATQNVLDDKGNVTSTNVEVFPVDIGVFPGARYSLTANNSDSGDVIVAIQEQPFPISNLSLTATGNTTTIFKDLGKAVVDLRINFTSNLRLKYCMIDGMGGVKKTAVAASGVSEDSAAADIAAATTLLANVDIKVTSFIPELYFNEENLRTTTTGLRVNWSQRNFEIPVGKNYTIDTAIDQVREEIPLEAVQTAMSIGNSDRGLAVVHSFYEEIADLVALNQQNPDIYKMHRLQDLSFAGTQCRPYVIRGIANYEDLQVSVMRETERLADRTAKIKQMLLNGLSNVVVNSLYQTSMPAGEQVVFKAIMHQVTADLLFKIPSYHTSLEDKAPLANGADYSFTLTNGYRVDIVTTVFHDWKDRIVILPIRESDPSSIFSAATIRSRGVYAGTVQGVVYDGATMNRDVFNSREFVLVTNPVGLVLDVQNVAFDLGTITPVDVR